MRLRLEADGYEISTRTVQAASLRQIANGLTAPKRESTMLDYLHKEAISTAEPISQRIEPETLGWSRFVRKYR